MADLEAVTVMWAEDHFGGFHTEMHMKFQDTGGKERNSQRLGSKSNAYRVGSKATSLSPGSPSIEGAR